MLSLLLLLILLVAETLDDLAYVHLAALSIGYHEFVVAHVLRANLVDTVLVHSVELPRGDRVWQVALSRVASCVHLVLIHVVHLHQSHEQAIQRQDSTSEDLLPIKSRLLLLTSDVIDQTVGKGIAIARG